MIRKVQKYFIDVHTQIAVLLAKMSIKMLYLLFRALDVLSTSLYNDKETCTWLEGEGGSSLSFSY